MDHEECHQRETDYKEFTMDNDVEHEDEELFKKIANKGSTPIGVESNWDSCEDMYEDLGLTKTNVCSMCNSAEIKKYDHGITFNFRINISRHFWYSTPKCFFELNWRDKQKSALQLPTLYMMKSPLFITNATWDTKLFNSLEELKTNNDGCVTNF